MRWNANGELCSPVEKKNGSESGVGIYNTKENRRLPSNMETYSCAGKMAPFESKITNDTIIQCYAPTEDTKDTKKNKFYA